MRTPTGTTHTSSLPEAAHGSTNREKLLHQAMQQMLVIRDIKRLAVKQLRNESLFPGGAWMGDGQFHALHILCSDGPLTVGNLAESCHLADPTVSKMLKSLENSGWVSRRTDLKNRRTVWVEVTPAGRELYDRVQARFQAGLTAVLAPLNNDQLHDLIVAFGHLERLVAENDAGL